MKIKKSAKYAAACLSSAALQLVLPSGAATVRPRATKEALVNPGMGWVYYHYDNSNWNYGAFTRPGDTLDWFPGASVIYFRLPWADLEPEEGKFRWDVIDTYAQSWIAAGKQVAFRFTCSESCYRYAVPKWVNVGVDAPAEELCAAWTLLDDEGTVRWSCVDESFNFRKLPPTGRSASPAATGWGRSRSGEGKG